MDAPPAPSRPIRPAILLGIALGGFFDGILLHQILQWHHLLSLVPGLDLRGLVLWDGLFHGLMYVLAAGGLWGLWRAERRGALPGRLVGAGLLAGFGLWHVVDSVLSHWVLGIHRIRVDAENPLAWDLLWLGLFGLLPMALAWGVARGGGGRAPRVAALLLVTLGLGAWALRAPPGQPYTLAVFRPGLSAQTVEARVEDLGGRVVWSAPDVALIDLPVERRWNLYGVGALIVSGTGLPQGCLGWSDVSA